MMPLAAMAELLSARYWLPSCQGNGHWGEELRSGARRGAIRAGSDLPPSCGGAQRREAVKVHGISCKRAMNPISGVALSLQAPTRQPTLSCRSAP